uniref:Uncharacterized protein ycf20 n=1 Tax=Erythrotrichia carnea TaxID=35151 RepID=A0A1C9CEF1_9RHOD|nr:hypothetical protein Eryt_102 [Erythrotrichia carnea]AOM66770.1 hypothetical protein Eryt_102 [Erythrotrichia carnea]
MLLNRKFVYFFRGFIEAICFSYPLGRLTSTLISLLIGFFLATVLATLPSQTGDWGVVAGGIAVYFDDKFEQFLQGSSNCFTFYNVRPFYLMSVLDTLNSIKIGIIYGLFVDAFKLGS